MGEGKRGSQKCMEMGAIRKIGEKEQLKLKYRRFQEFLGTGVGTGIEKRGQRRGWGRGNSKRTKVQKKRGREGNMHRQK